MNVRLFDGTVRCAGCFDSSTYESETADPCTYCGATPEPMVEVPVVLYHRDGDTVGAYQPGLDAAHALDCLDRVTSTPGNLWYGWSYVALA